MSTWQICVSADLCIVLSEFGSTFMHVILIVPRSDIPEQIRADEFDAVLPREHIGTGYLASALRMNGIDASILDAEAYDLPVASVLEKLRFVKDDAIIGITCNQSQYRYTKLMLNGIRDIGFEGIICIGGELPTLAPNFVADTLRDLDYIFCGEGETEFPLFASLIHKGNNEFRAVKGLWYKNGDGTLVNTGMPVAIRDLDKVPVPYHYVMKNEKDTGVPIKTVPAIHGSRGCKWGSCTFCSTAESHRRIIGGEGWRCRSSKNIIDEIAQVKEEFGSRYFVFTDEEIFDGTSLGYDRMQDLCILLKDRKIGINFMIGCRASEVNQELFSKLRSVGLSRVLIGLESSSQRCLDAIKKGTSVDDNKAAVEIVRKLDIELIPGFIPFYPNSTLEDVKKEFHFLVEYVGYNKVHKYTKKLRPDYGTPLFKMLQKQGRLIGEFPFYSYCFKDQRVQNLYEYLQRLILMEGEKDPGNLYRIVCDW